jgi:cytochrome P450
MTTTDAPADLQLANPKLYLSGVPHDAIAEMRRRTPVAWQEMRDEPGFWAVLRHADIVTVARHPELFSAEAGGIVLENQSEQSLAMMRNMLLAMDPPRHQTFRRPLAETFKATVIENLEPQIRAICREIMAEVAESGPDVEFVHDVTSALPTRVMGQLMGLPEDDWGMLHALAERQTSSQDADYRAADADAHQTVTIQMAMYAIEFAARRRLEPPQEDLTTLVLECDFGGHPMSDIGFGSFFVQLVTAGNDTTKTMLSSGLLALLQHPDQLQAVRADPSLIPGAVEEILRYANPLHYFRRTATQDTELGGTPISAGDKVSMYYTSGNRDELVFDDPQTFDITRSPNRHLSFGMAEHFCLGVHLARLEGRVFFEELLAAFNDISLTGDPVHLRSNLNNGYKRLPVRLGGYQKPATP